MKLSMHALHAIPDVLTKWHVQIMLILAVILFLRHTRFAF
jgi:hypothetical protein